MSQEGYISLYQFTKRIEGALMDPSVKYQWVTLEINHVSVHPKSGHCYLEAVEKSPSGTEIAKASANIWVSNYNRIAQKFRAATGTDLQRGMKILANVSANYHSLYGLSLNISDIDPAFTLGENERIRRETMQRLKADGIWDMNRALLGDNLVVRIAVVSSPTAAGYGDFCHHIEESGLKVDITLFESLMQGNQAEKSIMDSLERICHEADRYDAIVIIRGGGATGDLDCFDGYDVCSAIAQMPLPVITGIGHDRDTSIADMVAAVPLKTPTAVAAWITDRIWDFLITIERRCDEINNRAKNLLMGMWNTLDSNRTRLLGTAGWILSERQLSMAECKAALTKITSAVAVGENARIARYGEMLRSSAFGAIVAGNGKTGVLEQNLSLRWNRVYTTSDADIERKTQAVYTAAKTTLERKSGATEMALRRLSASVAICREKTLSKISLAEVALRNKALASLREEQARHGNLDRLLRSHDPKNVLGRGYALLRKGGHVVPSATGLSEGDRIEILLRDATVESEIKKIK